MKVTDIFDKIIVLLYTVIPILVTLAVVYFIWGVIQYTISPDEEAKKGAKGKIVNGLIGLFVMVSLWGIVRVMINTFGIGEGTVSTGFDQNMTTGPDGNLNTGPDGLLPTNSLQLEGQ